MLVSDIGLERYLDECACRPSATTHSGGGDRPLRTSTIVLAATMFVLANPSCVEDAEWGLTTALGRARNSSAIGRRLRSAWPERTSRQIGRESCRERVCQYV